MNTNAWTLQLESTDLDRMAAEQAPWRLRYEQLSPGPYHGELRLVQLPGLRLLYERHNRALRLRGRLGDGCYGFALLLEAGAAGDAVHHAGCRVQGDAILMGRGDDIDRCTPAGAAVIAIAVERSLLAPLWQQLYGKPLAPWLEHPVAAVAAPVPAAALRQLHGATLERISQQPALLADAAALLALRDALLLEWIEAIPPRVDPGELDALTLRRRLVERACAHVLARPESPPTISQLAREVGASPRKLAYCFAAVLGTSPARYLRLLRLNATRTALRQPGAQALGVQEVAARQGFGHFGQYASDYRRLFGERPSQTLQTPSAAVASSGVVR